MISAATSRSMRRSSKPIATWHPDGRQPDGRAAPAAADAVARAKRLGTLAVGLHVVLVDGAPVSPPAEVPALVGTGGASSTRTAGARRAPVLHLRQAAWSQLAAEIRAQFEAFRKTGLALDHVNATQARLISIPTVARLARPRSATVPRRAAQCGLPAEPMTPLRRAFPRERPAWRRPGQPVVAWLRNADLRPRGAWPHDPTRFSALPGPAAWSRSG